MRRPLGSLLLFGCLALGRDASAAPGVNLSWDACTSQGGVQNKTFACDDNAAAMVMVGSFTLAANQPHCIGAEIRLDLQAQSDSLPAWWMLGAGTCRETALS